jgi:short-subunit dehydrogenase
VNVSSVGDRMTMPLSGWFQAAKYALEGASDALRMEVARRNVQLVLIERKGSKAGIFEEGIFEDGPDSVLSRTTKYADSYRRIMTEDNSCPSSQPFQGGAGPARLAS